MFARKETPRGEQIARYLEGTFTDDTLEALQKNVAESVTAILRVYNKNAKEHGYPSTQENEIDAVAKLASNKFKADCLINKFAAPPTTAWRRANHQTLNMQHKERSAIASSLNLLLHLYKETHQANERPKDRWGFALSSMMETSNIIRETAIKRQDSMMSSSRRDMSSTRREEVPEVSSEEVPEVASEVVPEVASEVVPKVVPESFLSAIAEKIKKHSYATTALNQPRLTPTPMLGPVRNADFDTFWNAVNTQEAQLYAEINEFFCGGSTDVHFPYLQDIWLNGRADDIEFPRLNRNKGDTAKNAFFALHKLTSKTPTDAIRELRKVEEAVQNKWLCSPVRLTICGAEGSEVVRFGWNFHVLAFSDPEKLNEKVEEIKHEMENHDKSESGFLRRETFYKSVRKEFLGSQDIREATVYFLVVEEQLVLNKARIPENRADVGLMVWFAAFLAGGATGYLFPALAGGVTSAYLFRGSQYADLVMGVGAMLSPRGLPFITYLRITQTPGAEGVLDRMLPKYVEYFLIAGPTFFTALSMAVTPSEWNGTLRFVVLAASFGLLRCFLYNPKKRLVTGGKEETTPLQTAIALIIFIFLANIPSQMQSIAASLQSMPMFAPVSWAWNSLVWLGGDGTGGGNGGPNPLPPPPPPLNKTEQAMFLEVQTKSGELALEVKMTQDFLATKIGTITKKNNSEVLASLGLFRDLERVEEIVKGLPTPPIAFARLEETTEAFKVRIFEEQEAFIAKVENWTGFRDKFSNNAADNDQAIKSWQKVYTSWTGLTKRVAGMIQKCNNNLSDTSLHKEAYMSASSALAAFEKTYLHPKEKNLFDIVRDLSIHVFPRRTGLGAGQKREAAFVARLSLTHVSEAVSTSESALNIVVMSLDKNVRGTVSPCTPQTFAIAKNELTGAMKHTTALRKSSLSMIETIKRVKATTGTTYGGGKIMSLDSKVVEELNALDDVLRAFMNARSAAYVEAVQKKEFTPGDSLQSSEVEFAMWNCTHSLLGAGTALEIKRGQSQTVTGDDFAIVREIANGTWSEPYEKARDHYNVLLAPFTGTETRKSFSELAVGWLSLKTDVKPNEKILTRMYMLSGNDTDIVNKLNRTTEFTNLRAVPLRFKNVKNDSWVKEDVDFGESGDEEKKKRSEENNDPSVLTSIIDTVSEIVQSTTDGIRSFWGLESSTQLMSKHVRELEKIRTALTDPKTATFGEFTVFTDISTNRRFLVESRHIDPTTHGPKDKTYFASRIHAQYAGGGVQIQIPYQFLYGYIDPIGPPSKESPEFLFYTDPISGRVFAVLKRTFDEKLGKATFEFDQTWAADVSLDTLTVPVNLIAGFLTPMPLVNGMREDGALEIFSPATPPSSSSTQKRANKESVGTDAGALAVLLTLSRGSEDPAMLLRVLRILSTSKKSGELARVAELLRSIGRPFEDLHRLICQELEGILDTDAKMILSHIESSSRMQSLIDGLGLHVPVYGICVSSKRGLYQKNGNLRHVAVRGRISRAQADSLVGLKERKAPRSMGLFNPIWANEFIFGAFDASGLPSLGGPMKILRAIWEEASRADIARLAESVYRNPTNNKSAFTPEKLALVMATAAMIWNFMSVARKECKGCLFLSAQVGKKKPVMRNSYTCASLTQPESEVYTAHILAPPIAYPSLELFSFGVSAMF